MPRPPSLIGWIVFSAAMAVIALEKKNNVSIDLRMPRRPSLIGWLVYYAAMAVIALETAYISV
jgi:hypothetical protein